MNFSLLLTNPLPDLFSARKGGIGMGNLVNLPLSGNSHLLPAHEIRLVRPQPKMGSYWVRSRDPILSFQYVGGFGPVKSNSGR